MWPDLVNARGGRVLWTEGVIYVCLSVCLALFIYLCVCLAVSLSPISEASQQLPKALQPPPRIITTFHINIATYQSSGTYQKPCTISKASRYIIKTIATYFRSIAAFPSYNLRVFLS